MPKPTTKEAGQTLPPAEPPKPTEQDKPPTDAEIERMKNEFLEGFGYGPVKKKEADQAPAEETPSEEAPAAPKTEDTPPAESPKPPKAEKQKRKLFQRTEPKPPKAPEPEPEDDPASPEPLSADDIAEKVSQRLGQKPSAQPEPAQTDLDGLEAVQLLESDPRFKGQNLVAKTKAFVKAEDAYRRAWLKENSGLKFDPQDEEHNDFYEQNAPPYTAEDLEMAQRAIREAEIEQRVSERIRREIEPTLRTVQADKAVREQGPLIHRSVESAALELLKAVPQFKDVVGEAPGLTEEIVQKLETHDPVAAEIVDEEAAALMARVEHLERLSRLGHIEKADPNLRVKTVAGTVAPYQDIIEAASEMEASIKAMPKAEQTDSGRTFVTRAERGQRLKAIAQANITPAEKRRKQAALEESIWYLTPEMIREKLVRDSAKRVTTQLKRIEAARGATGKPVTNATAQHAPASLKPAPKPPAAIAAASHGVDNRTAKPSADDAQKSALYKSMGW